MKDEEFEALYKQLIHLYGAAMDGDKKDIVHLFSFAESLLKSQYEASKKRSEATSAKKGKAAAIKIWTLAIEQRRDLIKEQGEDELDEVAEPEWDEIVEEVISHAKKNGITTKPRTIVEVLNKYRNFIEKIDLDPHKRA